MKEEQRNVRDTLRQKRGCVAPTFVPATRESKILKMINEGAKETEKKGIKFNLIETGGTTIKRELQNSNPIASPECSKVYFLCCKEERGGGGPCPKSNV